MTLASIIIVGLVTAAIIGYILYTHSRKKHTGDLKGRFGTEYDRAVAEWASDIGDHGPRLQIYIVVGVPPFGVDEHGVAFLGALQESLGQLGTLIRPFGLGSQHDDLSVESRFAQGFGGLGAGKPGAGDHEGSGHGRRSILVG